MKKLKWLIALCTLIVCNDFNAQSPADDAGWIIQANLSDEFDTTALRTYKWNNNYWNWTTIANGAEINYPANLLFNGSTLKIKADTLAPNYFESDTNKLVYGFNSPGQGLTYAYQGGVVQSKAASYTFGYIEISAKFPSRKYSLWPAFWLFNGSCTPGSKFLNESDIAENYAEISYSGNKVGNFYHISDTTCNYPDAINGGVEAIVLPSTDSLSGAFHKFALQWDPHRMVYYFDGIPTLSIYNTNGTGIPQNGMFLFLNFCVDPAHAFLPADWNGEDVFGNPPVHGNKAPTRWPQYFEIEYLRYYKLTADCSTNATICVPADYDRKVKQTIVTNSACTPTYNPSTAAGSYTLRATDYVLIDEGITIDPTGTGYFMIETMACPQ
jgi:hypothetical protein